jgi:rhodanese-related sulfurtransferase
VARLLNNEDSTIQIIDLRSPGEYRYSYIPGAINIPFESFLDEEYQGYIDQAELKNILYSNGDIISSQAWMYASQMGFGSIKVMKGGMNEWYRTVMLSEFSGNRISPRENALYENRYRARKFFIQMNSLPDSLKTTFLAARKAKEMELVGGCE